MIDWLVNRLFWWAPLREALLAEATFYNSITTLMNDPESMKTAAAYWNEGDGWRGWSIKEDGTYYFHDIPEHSLEDIMLKSDESDKLDKYEILTEP